MKNYNRISCNAYDMLELFAVRQTVAEIIFEDANGAEIRTNASIKRLFTEQKAEYAVLSDGSTLRLDQLKRVGQYVFAQNACNISPM